MNINRIILSATSRGSSLETPCCEGGMGTVTPAKFTYLTPFALVVDSTEFLLGSERQKSSSDSAGVRSANVGSQSSWVRVAVVKDAVEPCDASTMPAWSSEEYLPLRVRVLGVGVGGPSQPLSGDPGPELGVSSGGLEQSSVSLSTPECRWRMGVWALTGIWRLVFCMYLASVAAFGCDIHCSACHRAHLVHLARSCEPPGKQNIGFRRSIRIFSP